ncbi:uncharacterized protein LOC107420113 [Ziziphus jujuba]|uniref:Uncharacterized protein LOC107420113 n=1 Tax=Ziziphus jujuba TaxID=326968 RepID=A0A6P3ZWM9_ZIZJJ|nr:uncharacterized protein LOC107420113 [Ziziphus jujuba]
MADEAQYSSGTDSASNKRKYEEQTTPPPPRRATGFSAPISSSPDSAPASYNSVPPPVDEIQLAKQRAQEIAARLFNNASVGAGAGAGAAGALDAKRPRVENGSGFDSNDKGFSSVPSDGKPFISNSNPSSIPVSYGFQGTSKRIDIPNGRVGVIIGKGGETIKYLQLQSGAKIQVTRDMDADLNSPTRMVELMGTPEQISKAEQLINDVLAGAESGGQGIVSRRLTGQAGSEQFVMKIPNNKVGLVIGKGGETIKNMQGRTGARIQVIPLHLPPGDTSIERTLQIDGTSEQIDNAKQLVNEVISENRVRNPSMAGVYPQQGYQARPPTSWAPPGAPQMQQPGYGYGQPGSYSGPSPQYNMSQPSYPGYPQPSSGGYPSNWDQSTMPPTHQSTQGSGYDYYGQQPPPHQQQNPGGPAAPSDNTGYNYSQPPASGYQQGQGYVQDGYGGYHAASQSGYGQPPTYDQQQGYSAPPSYGNVTNPTQDVHSSSYGSQGDSTQVPPVQPSSVGQQGYGSSQQPSPNPAGYPPQGANQAGYGSQPPAQPGYGSQPPAQPGYGPGYGAPQTQKASANPPVYGQATQSPSTPGGYGQPAAQPGYTHSQPPPANYAQPDSGPQRGPPSSYSAGVSQPGYGPPPYGAPPGSQGSYGQVPPYNASYGSGYSQPPPYSGDGNASGNTRGGYDAAPTSQNAQQGGVAKSSPQS